MSNNEQVEIDAATTPANQGGTSLSDEELSQVAGGGPGCCNGQHIRGALLIATSPPAAPSSTRRP